MGTYLFVYAGYVRVFLELTCVYGDEFGCWGWWAENRNQERGHGDVER